MNFKNKNMLMFSQPQNKSKQGQGSSLQNFRNFLQNKIAELDKLTNKVIIQLAELLFENSYKLKSEIFAEWRKIHFSEISLKEIQESERSIGKSVNAINDRLNNIMNHAKLVFQQQIVHKDPLVNKNNNNQINSKLQIISNRQQQIEEPKNLNIQCPICNKELSNGSSFVKHMRKHNIEMQSQGFDCPHCDASFSQSRLILQHLFKSHFVTEDYQITKKKSYYCPFMKQKFPINQCSQLTHFIRSSPLYTKAIDQIMVDQFQPEYDDGYRVTPKIQNQPHTKAEQFIRGVTKPIYVNDRMYGCPICGLSEFETLKYLGGHIRDAHNIKFRNKLFCPHCQIEYSTTNDLSTHLICIHGIIEENSQGVRNQIYTTIDGENYGDFSKLRQHLMSDENYLTFFSSSCKSEPMGQVKVQQD